MRGGERDTAREGGRDGENMKTGYVLFIKATTHPKTSAPLAPQSS